MSTIRLGSQLFINRNDSAEQIRQWVADMHVQGFSLIRLFLSWDLLERREGHWNFAQFDQVFSAAAGHDMQIVATLMSVSPPGWMRSTRGMQDIGDLDDPAFWDAGLHYIEKVVSRYAAHPALNSWILWNEPSRMLSTDNPRTVNAFRTFLKEKYHSDIEALNKHYFHQFDSFEQILQAQDKSSSQLEFMSYAEDIDWLEFSCADLSRKLQTIAAHTRQYDAQHKIHINPHRISQCMSEHGQDIWQQAKLCDFIGSSVHPPWHSVRFPKERIQQSVAMFADMMRSATPDPDGLFWVTELQGGPTVFSAFQPSGPRPQELRNWIWESAASGAKAILFWCYNNRDDGFEAGEWGLIQDNGRPSKRLQAIMQCATEIKQAARVLDHCTPHCGEIGILISSKSWNLGMVEGEGDERDNPRNKQMASDAVCGAYCMAQDLGFEVRFIHEEDLAGNAAIDIPVLLVPGCTALADNSISALLTYCSNGGHLIADGLCGWKYADGRLARERHGQLEALFGASVGEIYGGSEASCALHNNTFDAQLMQICFENNENCIARWDDGNPAIIRNIHQQGSAARIGSVFFQNYFICDNRSQLQVLRDLLPASQQPPLRMAKIDPGLRLRRLQHPDGEIAILINCGDARTVQLKRDEDTDVYDLDGRLIESDELQLQAHDIHIFQLQLHQTHETASNQDLHRL